MLYREIIAVCSETHTKHINTLCGHNIGYLRVTVSFIAVIPNRGSAVPWGTANTS